MTEIWGYPHVHDYLVFLDTVNQFKSSLHHTWRSKIYIQHLLGEGDRHHNIFHLEVNKNSLPKFFFLPQKWQLRVHWHLGLNKVVQCTGKHVNQYVKKWFNSAPCFQYNPLSYLKVFLQWEDLHAFQTLPHPPPGSDWKYLTVAGRAEMELLESEVTKEGLRWGWGQSVHSLVSYNYFCSHLTLSVSGVLCFMKNF